MKVKSNQEIIEFLTKYANQLNVEIFDVEFKQGKNPSLTIFIEKEGGIDLDTLELFHKAIFDPIDELDPTFGEKYTLNVSSPGVDRPFKSEKDFLSHINKKVEVKLYSSIKGKKFYDGELLSYDGKSIVLKVDAKNTFTIDLKNIVKINEYIDF
ncbi:MAG: ribosome maturation factor RimP [Clostridia bacterium]|nr:ribosome maturation factor RimP [Clostridia bacterium]